MFRKLDIKNTFSKNCIRRDSIIRLRSFQIILSHWAKKSDHTKIALKKPEVYGKMLISLSIITELLWKFNISCRWSNIASFFFHFLSTCSPFFTFHSNLCHRYIKGVKHVWLTELSGHNMRVIRKVYVTFFD